MTKAQQTISIGLLVTAVRTPHTPPKCHGRPMSLTMTMHQLYLACLYQLIPVFSTTVQDKILPIVCLNVSFQ